MSSSPADRRRTFRYGAQASCTVNAGRSPNAKTCPALAVNWSAEGLLISCKARFRLGEGVEIDFGNALPVLRGRVVRCCASSWFGIHWLVPRWASYSMGVQLDGPIPHAVFKKLLAPAEPLSCAAPLSNKERPARPANS